MCRERQPELTRDVQTARSVARNDDFVAGRRSLQRLNVEFFDVDRQRLFSDGFEDGPSSRVKRRRALFLAARARRVGRRRRRVPGDAGRLQMVVGGPIFRQLGGRHDQVRRRRHRRRPVAHAAAD